MICDGWSHVNLFGPTYGCTAICILKIIMVYQIMIHDHFGGASSDRPE